MNHHFALILESLNTNSDSFHTAFKLYLNLNATDNLSLKEYKKMLESV